MKCESVGEFLEARAKFEGAVRVCARILPRTEFKVPFRALTSRRASMPALTLAPNIITAYIRPFTARPPCASAQYVRRRTRRTRRAYSTPSRVYSPHSLVILLIGGCSGFRMWTSARDGLMTVCGGLTLGAVVHNPLREL